MSSHASLALISIVGVQAVTNAAVLLAGRREQTLRQALPYLVSGAAGVLLATACLDLLPEAVRAGGPEVWQGLLVSLLVLFCAQAFAHSVHDTAERPEVPERPAFPVTSVDLAYSEGISHRGGGHVLPQVGAFEHVKAGSSRMRTAPLLFGSALHSTVDGMAIAAAFGAGKRPGWSAAFAILLHELPHRLGDFSLLLHSGFSRRSAAQAAVAAGSAAFLGWAVVVVLGRQSVASRWMLPVSAGSFLYIALVDLVPKLQAHRRVGRMWWEVICLLSGAAFIAFVIRVSGE